MTKNTTSSATQHSRVLHHAATQFQPETRDTCSNVNSDELEISTCVDTDSSTENDSAIDVKEMRDKETQFRPDKRSLGTEIKIQSESSGVQIEIVSDKDRIMMEEVEELRQHMHEMEKMLSYFYIPVQYNNYSDQVDFLINFLNNVTLDEESNAFFPRRTIALHPTSDKNGVLTTVDSYLTAANNSPDQQSALADISEFGDETDSRFDSFETETDALSEELKTKLDLAYKVDYIFHSLLDFTVQCI